MTDNEVVKDLEEMAGYKSLNVGTKEVLHRAIDLINRQKALGKKNENTIRLAEKTIKTQGAEIERLKSDNDILSKNMHNLCKELECEKIKNF